MQQATKYWVLKGLLILLGVGLLAVIIAPNFTRARETSGPIPVWPSKMRIIESAKEQWVLENKKQPSDPVTLSDLTGYFKNNSPPKAEEGERYELTTAGEPVKCIVAGRVLHSAISKLLPVRHF